MKGKREKEVVTGKNCEANSACEGRKLEATLTRWGNEKRIKASAALIVEGGG